MSELSLEALLQTCAIAAHHVLEADEDAQHVARELRKRVSPGQRVLLAQRPQRSPWARLKALLDKSEPDADLIEVLAGSLLMAGFEAPALAADTPALVAVWAHMPSRSDPLDQVFSNESRNL